MTRLASTAKAGFFPTPERVTEWITRGVLPAVSGGKLLDPCCGEGVAAQYVANAWQLEGYGIEIDAERALEASGRLHRVLHLDCASARMPHQAFQAIWLNPPYDSTETEGRRTEYTFLRDTTKWLQPGGLLVYIVPQYRVDARMAGFLATAYELLQAYRFPDPQYATFRQAVIFGVARKEPARDEDAALALLQQCRGTLDVLPEKWNEAERYALLVPVESKFYFRGTEINPQEALTEAIEYGGWKTAEWGEWLAPHQELAALRPLMPLKKGHLAMLIAAGLMQNLRLDAADGTESLLVKGRTYKLQEKVESDDEDEEIVRDRFVTEIVTLNLRTGSHEKIVEPAELAAFVEKWRDVLTRNVMETFVPLYQFNLAEQGSQVETALNRLSRHRHLPGRKETGLFAAQKHVAVALWKRLQMHNSAILVGEMGTGKTTVSSAVSELIRNCDRDNRPSLILCPPHLVNKWIREIQQIIPMAFAIPLYRLTDVSQFVKQVGRLAPGTPAFAVLSREMAKLGSGWRAAYTVRRRYARVTDRRGNSHIEKEQFFACPRCGYPVHEMEGGQEIALVHTPAYFEERKRYCSQCREPLFQMEHLRGITASANPQLIESEARPPTQRYPIAEFIARRYRGFFKLLICDEVHQMKGQSTDQGYALGSLVRACSKTLALTGTIYGGRATSLFFLLHRLSPEVRVQFKWTDGQRWAERYGILLRRVGVR